MTAGGIDRPIFIFGSGRSGTTLVFNLLARHPSLGWFSQYNHRVPQLPLLSLASRLGLWKHVNESLTSDSGSRSWQEYLPRPSAEANHLWARLLRAQEHSRYPRLVADDVRPKDREQVSAYIGSVLAWQGGDRFISKCTNHTMRTLYLLELFPDARFVHIVRDGRAVANSLRKEPWWPRMGLWWSEGVTPLELVANGQTHLTVAARHWKEQMAVILADREQLPAAQYLELRYETYTEDPDGSLRTILDFCQLQPHPSMADAHRRIRVDNRNFKWLSEWSPADREEVEALLTPLLRQLGYSVE